MKKILPLLLITTLFVTGCGVAKLENGQDAVVKLKGKDISVNNLYDQLKDKYAVNVLIDMIDKQILADEYSSDEVKEEIETKIQSQIDSWLENFGDEATLLKQTSSYFGVSTMEGLREYLNLQFLRTKAAEDYAKTLVTDKEIKEFYDETIFGDIEASHILIKADTKDGMTDEETKAAEAKALKEAKSIIEKLKNGEDFAKLAKKYSDDEGSKADGGELGYFTHGKMVAEFEEAAVALKVGKYTTEPVKSSFGYHIILKTNQKEKASLDKVKSDIIDEISADKIEADSTINIDAMVELRKEYKISFEDSELKKKYEAYIESSISSAKETDAAK